MATITIPHRCLKCRETIGTVSCEGCKDIFCIKHITEHRKELSIKLNNHLFKHNHILKQLLDKEEKNESSKKHILSQIDQWEICMIERVRYKAELARERLCQLTDNAEKVIIENAQELTEKINKRDKTENFLEEDIERLKQSIIHVKQAFDKLIRQSDVELYVEPSYMIDWNHLIYVREKSVKVISSLVYKQTTSKYSEDAKSSIDSNQQRISISNFISGSSSSSSISSDDENNLHEINSNYYPYSFMDQLSNEPISSSAQTKPSPPQLEEQVALPPAPGALYNMPIPSSTGKRQRQQLAIIDPISHKAVEMVMTSRTTDSSHTPLEVKSKSETTSSSSATQKAQKQEELASRLAELLRGSPKT